MDTTNPDTPTTAKIRGIVKTAVLQTTGNPDGGKMFDRWLSEHDREISRLTRLVEQGRTFHKGTATPVTDPRLEELRNLHSPDPTVAADDPLYRQLCTHCDFMFPCPTRQIIDQLATPKPRRLRRRFPWSRIPKNAVYVGKRSKWANPFKAKRTTTVSNDGNPRYTVALKPPNKAAAIQLYRDTLTTGIDTFFDASLLSPVAADVKKELAGRDLVCECPPGKPCYADVLLELANSDPNESSEGDA